jgi:hypothetical protein
MAEKRIAKLFSFGPDRMHTIDKSLHVTRKIVVTVFGEQTVYGAPTVLGLAPCEPSSSSYPAVGAKSGNHLSWEKLNKRSTLRLNVAFPSLGITVSPPKLFTAVDVMFHVVMIGLLPPPLQRAEVGNPSRVKLRLILLRQERLVRLDSHLQRRELPLQRWLDPGARGPVARDRVQPFEFGKDIGAKGISSLNDAGLPIQPVLDWIRKKLHHPGW